MTAARRLSMRRIELALRAGIKQTNATLIGRSYDTSDPGEVDEFVARIMELIRRGA